MAKTVHLDQLVPHAAISGQGNACVEVSGLTADSRAVKPGYLFAALPGTQADGARFIRSALDKGAVAILTHGDWQAEAGNDALAGHEETPVFDVRNPRRALAVAASRFYGAQPDIVCAITGTNGKTSIASFTRQIWHLLGRRAASMGTLGVRAPEAFIPLGHTTPDPVEIHRVLNGLSLAGVNRLAMEASSHGLSQYRLDGVSVAAAAFTNLTRDHLDYHKDFDDYLFSKMRLLGEILTPGAAAVLNADADFFDLADQLCWSRGIRCLSVGQSEHAVLRLVSQNPQPQGQTLQVRWQGQDFDIALPLIGGFQAMNALMAAALVIATGEAARDVFAVLPQLKTITGRMQMIGGPGDAGQVLVDYAHTPDALETVLEATRVHTAGRLHVVVGCGGDRDKGKRPQMGAIAARLADTVYVTDDNPRGEEPGSIRAEILAGTGKSNTYVEEIGDRRDAIRTAVAGLNPGDLLIVAGKGHETGQVVGDKTLAFSDIEEVEAALEATRAEGAEKTI